MAIQLECPGCKATLNVEDSFAGKQGKCIHCGHRVIVPNVGSAAAVPISTTLFEATPEAMMREIAARGESAVMFLFRPAADGSYDLTDMPDTTLKCIVTEDVNATRFGQFIRSVSKRFGMRGAVVGSAEPVLYELKGDALGMSLDEFKQKYGRPVSAAGAGRQERMPLCSDEAWGANRAALHVESWHADANIIYARIDMPAENNSPTVAGVKTDLLLYQFVDGKLFRISAFFPTDQFHVVRDAAEIKYGPVTEERLRPRQLVWDNPVASVILTRGMVHPPEASTLVLVQKSMAALAESRAPRGAGDI